MTMSIDPLPSASTIGTEFIPGVFPLMNIDSKLYRFRPSRTQTDSNSMVHQKYTLIAGHRGVARQPRAQHELG